MSVTMRPSQLATFLQYTLKARLPILVAGKPGGGKTDIVKQSAIAAGYDIQVSHPVVEDPTDPKGIPWPKADGLSATFLPFGPLANALHSTRPLVWFVDDIGQATDAVQAAYMQLFLARAINGHKLPDHVTFIAATNRRTDKAGVRGILEPVKSRFASIIELETNLEDYCNWANQNDVAPECIAFPRFRPDLLHAFTPTTDMSNSPSPRTWNHVSQLLKLNLPAELEYAAYSGAIGEGAASEFIGFLRIFRTLPNPDSVIANPAEAPIPTGASTMYALVSALAYRATPKNFSAIYQYATRLYDAKQAEMAVFLIRDCLKRDGKISSTPAFTQFVNSQLGKLVLGQ